MQDIRFADHAVSLMWARADRMDYSSLSYSSLHADRWEEWNYIVPVLTIDACAYGDYSGGMMERSNHRVIMADNMRIVREITGDYCSRGIAMTLPRTVVRRLNRAGRSATAAMACDALADMIDADTLDSERSILCDVIASLADYPVIDESDMSELEWETITSDDSWWTVSHDMADAVARSIPDADGYAGNLDVHDALTDTESDAFRSWFGDFISNSDSYPHCEDAAGSIAWNGLDDDAVTVIIDSFRATGRYPWSPARVSLTKAYVSANTYTER